ncbi:hypothetical protein IRJ41_015193, partial [Triplophysa rosa]
ENVLKIWYTYMSTDKRRQKDNAKQRVSHVRNFFKFLSEPQTPSMDLKCLWNHEKINESVIGALADLLCGSRWIHPLAGFGLSHARRPRGDIRTMATRPLGGRWIYRLPVYGLSIQAFLCLRLPGFISGLIKVFGLILVLTIQTFHSYSMR